MRAVLAAILLAATSTIAVSDDQGGFLDLGAPPEGYTGGLGLITLLGPTGMFQNPTSGIAPKYAFTVESCMTFREDNGEHFGANGVLVQYSVTDWLEIGGFGVFAHGLNPAVAGDSDLQLGQVNARARLMRDEGGMPEVSIGAIGEFGDDPLTKHSTYLAASKGFALNDGPVLKSVRFHAGFRQSWPEIGNEVSTAFGGIEIEVIQHLFLIGEVNSKDNDAFVRTPWSLGLQYKSSAFGFSAAVIENGNDSELAYYVGIGVSY